MSYNYNVQLILTKEQALLLDWVIANIGGDPAKSGRRIVDQIAKILHNEGIYVNDDIREQYPIDWNKTETKGATGFYFLATKSDKEVLKDKLHSIDVDSLSEDEVKDFLKALGE